VIVTYVIIALNIGVFLIDTSRGGWLGSVSSVQRDLALFGPAIEQGEWYRLVTSGFTHAGLLHLAMNMLFIWQAGLLLEPALGRIRFTLLYVSALLCGAAGALLVEPNVFTVGASGAAFGLLGAAVVAMRLRGIPVLRSPLGTLLLVNLGITFLVPGISVGGHVGGLVGGAVVGAVLLRPHRGHHAAWDVLVPIGVGVAAVAVSLAVV
jgi:membrane associated rhomboid family serine protease